MIRVPPPSRGVDRSRGTVDDRFARLRAARAHGRLLARGQLPHGRADLPSPQPAPARAADARRRQAAPARSLGDDARAQLRLRPSQSHRSPVRPRHDLRHGAGPRRPRHRREHLSRGNLQRVLSRGVARHGRPREALRAVLRAGRHSEPRRTGDAGIDQRRRRARLFACTRVRRRVRQSGSRRRVRDRRRRGRNGRARRELSLEQVPEPAHRRCGAADPASQRLQDREPDDPSRRFARSSRSRATSGSPAARAGR